MRELLGEWSSRGYLPHYQDGTCIQAVTYRLADALPEQVVRKLKELGRGEGARRVALERYLDASHGACLLQEPGNALCVVRAWQHFNRRRYLLHAWVVMPNHVHVLVEPLAGWRLREIVHSWKSYTAKRILAGSAGVSPATLTTAGGTPALPAAHRVWQREYFDRYIRDQEHYVAMVRYIHGNPVSAGLCDRSEHWPWSSAHPQVAT